MADLLVHPQKEPLRGQLAAPPDAATAEVAILLAALAPSGRPSRLAARGISPLAMPEALVRLGIEVAIDAEGISVRGGRMSPPSAALPCPLQASPMGLLTGLLAAQPFASRLEGDAVERFMDAVARTIRARGGSIEGRLDPRRPGIVASPVEIAPARLSELSYEAGPGSVAAKTAALGSGLFAEGETFVHEVLVGDDRCERQLAARGAAISAVGPMLRLEPLAGPLEPIDCSIPGDPALAAVLAAACLAVPESLVGLRGVTISTSRSGWLEALRDAGATLAVVPSDHPLGEATADLHLRGERLAGLRLAAERAHRVGVPLAILAALAALAGGESELCDVPLGHPTEVEDALALLEAFGIEAAAGPGGLTVCGSRPRASELTARDGWTAMGAVILALAAEGPSLVRQADDIVSTFPRFVGCLRALGARLEVRP